jgi:hypothetical protein
MKKLTLKIAPQIVVPVFLKLRDEAASADAPLSVRALFLIQLS